MAFGAVLASVVVALLTFPDLDGRLCVLISSFVFVVPLASALWHGDKERVNDLVRARTDPLTVLIVKIVYRALVGVAALCASLWAVPIVLLFLVAGPQSKYLAGSSPSTLPVMLVLTASGWLPWWLRKITEHFPADADSRETPVAAARILAALLRPVQWGNRWLAATLGKDAWAVGLSLTVLFAGVSYIALVFVYATVPDPVGVTPFDHFPMHGFNRDLVLIVTALTGFVVYDLLGLLRTRARTAGCAITLVFFTFAVSVIAAAVVGPELKAHTNVIAGICFGISLAALLDVAQATAAGIAWKLRPRRHGLRSSRGPQRQRAFHRRPSAEVG